MRAVSRLCAMKQDQSTLTLKPVNVSSTPLRVMKRRSSFIPTRPIAIWTLVMLRPPQAAEFARRRQREARDGSVSITLAIRLRSTLTSRSMAVSFYIEAPRTGSVVSSCIRRMIKSRSVRFCRVSKSIAGLLLAGAERGA